MTASIRMLLATALFFGSAVTAAAQSVPAVHADVETSYQFQDGRQVKVAGRFYRSADGKVREDSGSGSLITDIGARTMTMLNAERKQALVLQMPEPIPHEPKPATAPAPVERGTHEGRVVQKTSRTSADGTKQEVWFASDLGTVVYSRIEAPGLTTIRTLRNVKAEQPASVVFEIPAGYEVTRRALPPESKGGGPLRAPKPTPGK